MGFQGMEHCHVVKRRFGSLICAQTQKIDGMCAGFVWLQNLHDETKH